MIASAMYKYTFNLDSLQSLNLYGGINKQWNWSDLLF